MNKFNFFLKNQTFTKTTKTKITQLEPIARGYLIIGDVGKILITTSRKHHRFRLKKEVETIAD